MKITTFWIITLSLFCFLTSCETDTSDTENDNNTFIIDSTSSSPTLAYLDSMILENPRDAAGYYERALYYQADQRPTAAVADLYSAMQLDSAQAEYYYLGGDLFIEMGDGIKAIQLMSKGINAFPENEELYLRATEYNYLMRNYDAAMNFVNDLIILNQYNADAYFLKGMIYKEMGKTDKALSTFQTCTEQDPTFYNAYMQLGLIHTDLGNDVAIEYFNNALKILPDSREAMYAIAYYYQKVGDLNTAIEEYRSLLKSFPKDHISFYNIGYCYMEMDSLDKSYSHFNIATQVQPQYTGAYYMKGFVAEKMGDFDNAQINYEQANSMLPNDETIVEALKRLEEKQS